MCMCTMTSYFSAATAGIRLGQRLENAPSLLSEPLEGDTALIAHDTDVPAQAIGRSATS